MTAAEVAEQPVGGEQAEEEQRVGEQEEEAAEEADREVEGVEVGAPHDHEVQLPRLHEEAAQDEAASGA